MAPAPLNDPRRGDTPPARREAIDWRAIERRLEAARAAVERVWSPGAADIRRILEERAKMLAREAAPTEAAEAGIELVEFRLARERYAVASEFVSGVFPLRDITPLPCTPEFVRGIINLRGEMLSVIDIGRLFELPALGLTDLNKVIVLESAGMEFGLLADAIGGVFRIQRAAIQPAPLTLTGIRADFLQGVTAESVAVLDAAKLLADERLVVREQVN